MNEIEFVKYKSYLLGKLSLDNYLPLTPELIHELKHRTDDGETLFITASYDKNKPNAIRMTYRYGVAQLWCGEKGISAYVIYKNYACMENLKGEDFCNWKYSDEIVHEYLLSDKFNDDYFEKGCIVEAIDKYGVDSFGVFPMCGYGFKTYEEAESFLQKQCEKDDELCFCCNNNDILDDYEAMDINVLHEQWLKSEECRIEREENRKNGNQKGGQASKQNNTKKITIKCKLNGDVFPFDTYKECMDYLCMKSKATFGEFLEGRSKYNKIYEIMS